MEADPVAYIFKHPAGKLFWALTDESNKEQPDVIPVYADSPAPVVPDEIDVNDVPRAVTYFKTHRDCYADGWNACHAAMLQGSQPVSQTYNLPELIEGMEVSIDVSTCDADLGNRYFGTVTEALELDTAKNGYILLVQDAEPNFDVNGNSPVTPDGWISCSERMPNEEDVLVYCSDTKEQMVGFHKGKGLFQFFYMNGVEGVCEPSHWMPLPEPPQEVK
ncbi:DUF551 domain-containing protein [Escherichia coli]|uniref:DUF551 domain-containing protein n=1 Tax=Escherichia coli TaxID=562 RepID=UPI003CD049F7